MSQGGVLMGGEDRQKILAAAQALFITQGYDLVSVNEIAEKSGVPLPALQSLFTSKKDMLHELLEHHDPSEELRAVFRQLPNSSPEDLLRTSLHGLFAVLEAHRSFGQLAMIDAQVNHGAYLTALFDDLIGDAAGFVNYLSTLPGVRPISTVMLGRALASLLIGFLATQQLAPESAQMALRLFPHKAWVEGLTDLILNGILEEA
jgi:AcrR family transcriptional regulator